MTQALESTRMLLCTKCLTRTCGRTLTLRNDILVGTSYVAILTMLMPSCTFPIDLHTMRMSLARSGVKRIGAGQSRSRSMVKMSPRRADGSFRRLDSLPRPISPKSKA